MAGSRSMFRWSQEKRVKACMFFVYLNSLGTLNFKSPSKPVHAYVIQVIIIANHMNGKDTHIRGLRVLGPTE
jgi:hypothetical protein